MKTPRTLIAGLALISSATAATGEPDAAKIASSRFETASQHLDLGGSSFAYTELNDLPAGIAELVKAQMQSDFAHGLSKERPVDVPGIIQRLGFANLECIGFSSKAAGDMFANKAVLITKAKPSGLLTALGPVNRTPTGASLAPASTHLLIELELNGDGVKETLLNALAVADPKAVAEARADLNQQVFPEYPITRNECAHYLTGKVILGIQLRENEPMEIEPGHPLPAIDAALIFENRPDFAEKLNFLSAEKEISVSENAAYKVYAFPSDDGPLARYKPLVTVRKSDNTVFFFTTKATQAEWIGKGPKLKDQPDFRRLCGDAQPQGVASAYLSPQMVEIITRTLQSVANSRQTTPDERTKVDTLVGFLMQLNKGASAHARQLDNGLTIKVLTQNSAFNTATISIANLMTEGFAAARETGLFEKTKTDAHKASANNSESDLPE